MKHSNGAFVLGMHRTGTSAVAGFLAKMGLTCGPADIMLPANEWNPTGYWERRDVVNLNQAILKAHGYDWYRVDSLTTGKLSVTSSQESMARNIVRSLMNNPSWFVKDPRISVLLAFWRKIAESAVCLIVHRDLARTVDSLTQRDGFPVQFSLALWEHYMLCALRHSHDANRHIVNVEKLLQNSPTEIADLRNALGSQYLDMDTPETELFSAESRVTRGTPGRFLLDEVATPQQLALNTALLDGSVLTWSTVPDVSPFSRQLLHDYAVVHSRLLDQRRRLADFS